MCICDYQSVLCKNECTKILIIVHTHTNLQVPCINNSGGRERGGRKEGKKGRKEKETKRERKREREIERERDRERERRQKEMKRHL